MSRRRASIQLLFSCRPGRCYRVWSMPSRVDPQSSNSYAGRVRNSVNSPARATCQRHRACLVKRKVVVCVRAEVLGDYRHLGVDDVPHEVRRDGSPILELGAVADPLPDLGPADLSRGSVLHQVPDGGSARAGQPGGQGTGAPSRRSFPGRRLSRHHPSGRRRAGCRQ